MKIIIIGSVAAGTSVAAKARRNNIENEIIVYEKDSDISYSVCGIPYYIGEDYIERDNLTPRNPEWFKKRFDIDIKTKHEVMGIHYSTKEISVKNLETGVMFTDKYDKLVLATGASPIIPNIEGINSPYVFFVRNIESADKIKSFIKENKPKKAVVVGGGFIGLEILENFVNLGIETTIVEGAENIVPGIDKEMALHIEKYLKDKEIKILKNSMVKKIDKNGTTLYISDNKIIETDIIVFSIGVKPNVGLAKLAGVKIGKTGGIKVNGNMQTSNPDIYAAGDCCEAYSLITGEAVYRPMGSTANKMGRIVGDVLTGGDLSFRGILGTGIVKIFDLVVATTGLTEKEAKKLGYDVEVIHNIKPNQTEYFKGSSEMVIKAVADRKTEKLIGVQIIGKNGVDKRIDVFATAITFGAKVGDLFHLDLAYAPPFSTTKDPVMYTGMILENALKRGRKIITASELINNRSKYTVIDVRSEKDFNKGHIEDALNIPLDKLKEMTSDFDKELTYVVHCNKGVTGNAAQNLMINLGFKEVYNLSGGFKQYKMS